MAHRFHLTLSDQQYAYLNLASERTSLSMAELVRRAVDEKYPASAPNTSRSQFTVAVWRRPSREGTGRRSGVRLE